MFELLPDEILCYLAEYFDIESNLNFGLTSKRHYLITNDYRLYIRYLKRQDGATYINELAQLANVNINNFMDPLNNMFKAYSDILVNPSSSAVYRMSGRKFKNITHMEYLSLFVEPILSDPQMNYCVKNCLYTIFKIIKRLLVELYILTLDLITIKSNIFAHYTQHGMIMYKGRSHSICEITMRFIMNKKIPITPKILYDVAKEKLISKGVITFSDV
jgi:hypothetical protein